MKETAGEYLEAILILSQRLPAVRCEDITEEFEIRKDTVNTAVQELKEKGYITVSDDGGILLTASGIEIAEDSYEKHQWFTSWLESIGVDDDTAAKDACRIEHAISSESFEAMKRHMGFMDEPPVDIW